MLKTEHYKKKYKLEWRKNNPEKWLAHRKVELAVRQGKLKKPMRCTCCGGSSELMHAHHFDYDFPLMIQWLCPKCHKERHTK